MARYVWTCVVLQALVVGAGHVSGPALNLSGILGTVVPFAVALVFGARGGIPDLRAAVRAGAVIGAAGAAAWGALAMVLSQQTWLVLTYAPVTHAFTGVLGGMVGRVAAPGSGPRRKGGGKPRKKKR